MNPRELVLLNPYSYPGQNSLVLANEDMACWLNGFSALWHPAALWQAVKPPRCETPYDHEDPKPGFLYAVPEAPPLILPDDWEQRVKDNGAIAFRVTTDRTTTLHNLREALQTHPEKTAGLDKLLDLPGDQVTPFFGLGLGHLLLGALSEAMEHENLLEHDAFWDDVQSAVASLGGLPYTPMRPPASDPGTSYPSDYEQYNPAPEAQEFPPEQANPEPAASSEFEEFAPPQNESAEQTGASSVQEAIVPPPDAWYTSLQNAANRLVSAREVLYPVTIHLLDVLILDEKRLDGPWPDSLTSGLGLNVVACGALLEKLAQHHPERFAELRQRMETDAAEVCGGCYVEREEPLLPVDSQLWNLVKGQAASRAVLGRDIQVFARRRFGLHPQLPLFLSGTGITRALALTLDESGNTGPQYQACVVGWPSPDGKQLDVFVRQPHSVDSAQTFFNLGHYWFKTTREDQTATLAFVHTVNPPAPWYHDMVQLGRLAPVLGLWTTFTRYFNETTASEQAQALSPDEFHADFLGERTNAHLAAPVSEFAEHARLRRRIDVCWTLAALHRGLAGRNSPLHIDKDLGPLEDAVEETFGMVDADRLRATVGRLAELEQMIAAALSERLQVRAADNQPGHMILNPCSFARRVALEFDGVKDALPIADPVKACQLDGEHLRLVVEVPALGFAWIPRSGPPGTPKPPMRLRLADANMVRNEFFEAEIDPATGGLRGIRDRRTMINRLAQRLVFNPGSTMRASRVQVTSPGPALGEIVTEGTLVGEHEQVLARFRQRFRAWLGRPVLELRVEIMPEQPPAGYPWHAYYGARFAWRDERAFLLRSASGTGYVTSHIRPQSPDYLELRMARQGTVIFPGGLPFHQRHEGRMLDVILIPEGEKATTFDLAIALDREQPMQTALGIVTPVPVVPTSKGPPHIGATGWLFHLDAPNLLLSRLHPGGLEVPVSSDEPPRDQTDAVTARLLECAGHSGHAEFRCVRNPTRAVLLNARGNFLIDASASGDGAFFEVSPGDLVQLQVEFS